MSTPMLLLLVLTPVASAVPDAAESVTRAEAEYVVTKVLTGKLKKFTDKKTIPQFIPQIWFGNEKLVAVSVILEGHIIFIEKNTFKMYQKGLCASDSVELVMRPNIRE